MSLDERLVNLLLKADELREQGREVHAEELCRDCPEALPELRRLMRGTGAVEHLLHAPETNPTPAPPRLPGYLIRGELGRGGMGVVYDAEQLALGRRVALKVLPVAPGQDPDRVARFQREVRAAARLQHPHIVPIYEVGQAEGVWYYAMQYIPGLPVSALLGRLRRERAGETPTPQPAETEPTQSLTPTPVPMVLPAEATPAPEASGLIRLSPKADPRRYFREVARLGRQVAEALACAHTRGVLHRDVKPANLLLDDAGRAWVADFGLAKIDDEELTQSGAVVGTLRYMAPEQLRGSPETRSDIYSLGLTLYELLTLRPAHDAPDQLQLLEQVAHEEPPRPRHLDRRIPRDLETIIRKAIRKEPTRRYAGAQELADDLGRFLEGKPVRARPIPAWERAVKWARRRPTAATLLAVCLLAGAALLAAGVAYDRQRRLVESEVNKALAEARGFQEGALSAKGPAGAGLAAKAREHAQRARALLELGPADTALAGEVQGLLEELFAEEKSRELLAELDAARLAQGRNDPGQNRFAGERAVPLFRKAFKDYGSPVGAGDPAAAAARLRQAPREVRDAVLDAWDEWLLVTADLPPGVTQPEERAWLRAVLAHADADTIGARVQQAGAEKDRARRKAALEQLAGAPDILRRPAGELVRLARGLQHTGAPEVAVRLLRRARQAYPGDFWINHDLGLALTDKEPAESVRYLTAAATLRPDSSGVRLNLGNALVHHGRLDEAVFELRQAVALDKQYAAAHCDLGQALYEQGHVAEAVACYRRALALDPRDSTTLSNLGNALDRQGKADEAIATYRQAVARNAKYWRAHYGLGNMLFRQGEFAESIASYRRALDLKPQHAALRCDYGLALFRQGQVDEAVAEYRQSLALDPKDPVTYRNLGAALRRQGKAGEAIDAFRKGLALEPQNAQAHTDLGVYLLEQQGQVGEAVAVFRQVVALKPNDAYAHYNLGNALRAQGQTAAAAAAYRQTMTLDANHAEAYCNLANLLQEQGDFTEALALFRQGHALGLKKPGWRYPSAAWVRTAERLVRLEKNLPAVLSGQEQPANAAQSLEYAQVCHHKKQFLAGARLSAAAFAAEPPLAGDLNAGHRYNAACTAALAAAGPGDDGQPLDAAEQARWRKQAVAWLRADLAANGRLLEGKLSRTKVRQRLLQWRMDPDLAGIRDPGAVDRLPREERAACRALWAEVEALLQKAASPPRG